MDHKKIKHHSTISRINKLKIKRRNKKIIKNSLLLILLIITFFFAKNIYLINKCKDLSYATNYYFTNGDKDSSLLRIQESKLIFCDTDSAVVQVTGLSKTKPHKKITFNGHFEKGKNDSWEMTTVYYADNL